MDPEIAARAAALSAALAKSSTATGLNIDGIQLLNDTREFVVDGGIDLPPGTMVFKLLDGGAWDIVGMVG